MEMSTATTQEIAQKEGAESVSSSEKPLVLKVENVSKKFCRNLKRSMIYGIQDLAKGLLGIKPNADELRKDEFWALKDINFELREGEILGIIGANGSGKSTLLRVLTGIFPPDKGRVWMDGTVGGIIALGAGMHPHMTGRENVYLNGTILGMSKEEIDEKFEEIVEFSEIGDFMDAPFSTYSSGMKVRLGFSVAVHCQPDILLVDEVLAVGDLSFQNKCMRKLKEVREGAKAVIFISHSLDNVELLCSRVMVVNKGIIVFDGSTQVGIAKYQTSQFKKGNSIILRDGKFEHKNSGLSYLKDVYTTDETGIKKDEFCQFESFYLNFIIDIKNAVKNPFISVALRDEKGNNIFWEMSQNTSFQPQILKEGVVCLTVYVKRPNLEPGKYFIAYGLKDSYTGEYHEKRISPKNNIVISGDRPARGIITLDTKWIFS